MNILITGASKGIGYQTALAFTGYGQVRNIAVLSRNEKLLQNLKSKCGSENDNINITVLTEDITDIVNNPDEFLNKLPFNSLDVLINNAGVLINSRFEEIKREEIAKVLDVNFTAPSLLIRILLPYLKRSKTSHVVNIGSMGGFQGSSKYPGLSYYSAAKAALASLTECLSAEFEKTTVKFNCLALGAVQTEMLNKAFPGYDAPVSAMEMGKYIAEFAINGSKYYSGKILPVTLSNP